MILDYIDTHKQEYGVEPICRVLSAHGCKIAPSTYYDACARRSQPSKRQVRDDLSRWNADDLEAVAHALNTRPRKTLGWKTPAEALNEQLPLLEQNGVATTD